MCCWSLQKIELLRDSCENKQEDCHQSAPLHNSHLTTAKVPPAKSAFKESLEFLGEIRGKVGAPQSSSGNPSRHSWQRFPSEAHDGKRFFPKTVTSADKITENEGFRETLSAGVPGGTFFKEGNSLEEGYDQQDVTGLNKEQYVSFNPETPFEVGGLAHHAPDTGRHGWPEGSVTGEPFHGCIRNIRINNQVSWWK